MYLSLVLHGVGTTMPWNILINAKTVSYVSTDYRTAPGVVIEQLVEIYEYFETKMSLLILILLSVFLSLSISIQNIY